MSPCETERDDPDVGTSIARPAFGTNAICRRQIQRRVLLHAQGYTLLRDSIEVVITARESDTLCEIYGAPLLTASTAVNGKAVTMLENNGSVNAQVPLTVVNTKGPDLPVTGDDGAWKYGVISILLMTGSTIAIILVLKGKKEPKSKR